MVHSNQTKNCPVIVQGVEVAQKVWGKNIAALKVKTMWKKTILVARYQAKILIGLIKLHKEVFLT